MSNFIWKETQVVLDSRLRRDPKLDEAIREMEERTRIPLAVVKSLEMHYGQWDADTSTYSYITKGAFPVTGELKPGSQIQGITFSAGPDGTVSVNPIDYTWRPKGYKGNLFERNDNPEFTNITNNVRPQGFQADLRWELGAGGVLRPVLRYFELREPDVLAGTDNVSLISFMPIAGSNWYNPVGAWLDRNFTKPN